MHKVVLAQHCRQPSLFDPFYIDLNGNILVKQRNQDLISNRDIEKRTSFTKHLRIEYSTRDNGIEMVKLYSGTIEYEEPLSVLFIRSLFGYNFNTLDEISGKVGLKTLKVKNRNIDYAYKIRSERSSTESEELFYDKWNSYIQNRDELAILHGTYYNKWCKFIVTKGNSYVLSNSPVYYYDKSVEKRYCELFLYYYRATLKRLDKARQGITSEVLVMCDDCYYFMDFYIPSLNLGIEIDGYHHYYDLNVVANDYKRTHNIAQIKNTIITRLPNNDVKKLSQSEMRDLLEVCFDRAGYLATKSLSELRELKYLSIKRLAKSILNRQSAANFQDRHTKYIIDGYRKSSSTIDSSESKRRAS